MKILHIDETFHPNYGYQANPLAKFQRAQGHEVTIATVEKKWLYPVYRSFGDDGTGLEEADAYYENTTGVKIIRVAAKGYVMRRLVPLLANHRTDRCRVPLYVFSRFRVRVPVFSG